jgi:hypothetical protein
MTGGAGAAKAVATASDRQTAFVLDIRTWFTQSDGIMKPKLLLVLSALTSAALAFAQAPPNYTPEEAPKHVGEIATVTGKVDAFHQSGKGNIFLNMGGKYPNQTFTAWIPSASAAQFPNAAQYEGQTISVSGKIILYQGKPEIKVTSPSQIVVR